LEVAKQTERYLLGGCIAEMSLLTLPTFSEDSRQQQYATFSFQGEDMDAVYAAAIKAGVPSLSRFALNGDRTAKSLLGAMGMSYAAFLSQDPHLRSPAVISLHAMEQKNLAGGKTNSKKNSKGGGSSLNASAMSTNTLHHYFTRLFELGDTNGNGVLEPAEMEDLLRKSGFQVCGPNPN